MKYKVLYYFVYTCKLISGRNRQTSKNSARQKIDCVIWSDHTLKNDLQIIHIDFAMQVQFGIRISVCKLSKNKYVNQCNYIWRAQIQYNHATIYTNLGQSHHNDGFAPIPQFVKFIVERSHAYTLKGATLLSLVTINDMHKCNEYTQCRYVFVCFFL